MELPSRLYTAKTLRVATLSTLLVDIEMDFGVHVNKEIHIEGVTAKMIPAKARSEAMHCLVVLLGSKRLLVRVNGDEKGDKVIARVFLNENTPQAPDECMETPYGTDTPRLDVATYYRYLMENGFNVANVKQLLNGKTR